MSQNRNGELTILTVNFNSSDWVNSNLEWLNESQKMEGFLSRFVVVDNSQNYSVPTALKSRVLVLDGPNKKEIVVPVEVPRPRLASLHHSTALNIAIQSCSTRFVLILDPDFFILYPSRISDAINYMVNHGVAIMGVPWHPKWIYHYRYFPAPHCMIIDLDKIHKEKLDFRPLYSTSEIPPLPTLLKVIHRIPGLKSLASNGLRMGIGQGGDTGSKIFQYCSMQPGLKWETFEAVFHPEDSVNVGIKPQSSEPESNAWTQVLNRFLETFLADRWCFIPKKRNYFTCCGFKERGFPDCTIYGWEEFIWKNNVWGVHVRSFPKKTSGQSLVTDYDIMMEFLSKVSQSTKA